MSDHEQYMRQALDLAEHGRYSVSPNPMVGCVIVRDDEVLATGWHERAGRPHAEVNALVDLGDRSASGATVYVSLEPCTRQGRTPPCTDALIEAGPARVVVATRDPSPEVSGEGIRRLREAGIEVIEGVCEQDARLQNEKFFRSIESGRPFVLIKAGMTLDGKLATVTGESRWITSKESRQTSLLLREEYDAIVIGSRTLEVDDPNLTRRLGRSEAVTPWTRVVIHTEGEIPDDARMLNDGSRSILYSTSETPLPGETFEQVRIDGMSVVSEVLSDLHQRGIRSVIVEGGGHTIGSFLEARVWDKMILFVAPIMVGGSRAPGVAGPSGVERLDEATSLRFESVERAGPDLVVTARPRPGHV